MKTNKPLNSSPSHLDLRLHVDGGLPLVLKVPTYWNEVEKKWLASIHLPKSKKLIIADAKDSFDLQNNFTVELSKFFYDPAFSEEVFSLFEEVSDE